MHYSVSERKHVRQRKFLGVYEFLRVAITKDQKPTGLKQQKVIISQF